MARKGSAKRRSKSRSKSVGRPKRKTSKSKSKSKGRRNSVKKQTKQSKLVNAVLKQSPYNVLSVNDDNTNMELFGKYKPMNPMSHYQNSDYPFYPGSNATGLLSGLDNPLKNATTSEPYLSRLLDLNRQTMTLVDGANAKNLNIKDTRPPPFLSGPAAVVGGASSDHYLSALSGMFPQLGSAGLSVSLNQQRKPLRTLDEMTLTLDQTPENENTIQGSNYMAIKDTDGFKKDFLFVKK